MRLGDITAGAWKDSNVQILANFSTFTNPASGGSWPLVKAFTSKTAAGVTMSSSRAASYSVDIDPRLGATPPTVQVLPDKSGAEVAF